MFDISLIPIGTARNGDEVLAQVQDCMRAEPLRVDMDFILHTEPDYETAPNRPYPVCGAQGCIRGWVQAMFGGFRFSESGSAPKNCDDWMRVLPLNPAEGAHCPKSPFDKDWYMLCYGGPQDYLGTKAYPWPEQTLSAVAYADAVIANIEKFRNKWKAELLAHTF